MSWERFWANWLLWFLFVLSIGLGSLFIVALEHLVGAKWSVPIRRAAERLGGLVLLAIPLGLVALLSLPSLYPWARPEAADDPLLVAKAPWLNMPFFSLRVLVCIVLWAVSHWILVGGSLKQDRTRDPRATQRARRFAPVYMIIFALTVTLVSFDWLSSLEPEWYSDVFGVYLFAGMFLSGLAATTLVVLHLMARGRLPGVGPHHLYNLGGFLFAFTVFWSYIGFAQYLLMWYANLPEEIVWYQKRIDGPWAWVVLLLALIHFVVPFFALIPSAAKRDPRRLRWVAALVLFSHWLDLYWLIFPVLGVGPLLGWPELVFVVGGSGLGLWWLGRRLRCGEDMPVGDPFLEEGLAFHL